MLLYYQFINFLCWLSEINNYGILLNSTYRHYFDYLVEDKYTALEWQSVGSFTETNESDSRADDNDDFSVSTMAHNITTTNDSQQYVQRKYRNMSYTVNYVIKGPGTSSKIWTMDMLPGHPII